MPEKTPPTYKWDVTLRDTVGHFTVEAAYSVVEDSGHMGLRDADHSPVFTAEPGLGCTFERREAVDSTDERAAQAEADAAFIVRHMVSPAEIRRMPYCPTFAGELQPTIILPAEMARPGFVRTAELGREWREVVPGIEARCVAIRAENGEMRADVDLRLAPGGGE